MFPFVQNIAFPHPYEIVTHLTFEYVFLGMGYCIQSVVNNQTDFNAFVVCDLSHSCFFLMS